MFKFKFFGKNRFVLTVTALLIASSVCFVWTRISSGEARQFAAADDFPRGALCYAQFQNLPQLIKLWNESSLKQKYLESANFAEFQNRHLALKLVSRWQEFNSALNFEADAATIAAATETRAAVAIYDIGKLEFVFIAPVTDEKFAATMFFQNQAKFDKNTLPDKTIYYSREVKADRGRQQQKIVFANVKGRFVLATSEDLLLRAVANINGKTLKDRLSDEPAFSALTEKFAAPHLATVWVNQTKLNEDWYFKHYWIPQNIEQLKEIRAGIFDFEMPTGKIVERRMLLLNNSALTDAQIPATEAAHLQAMIPATAAFSKMQSVSGKEAMRANQILANIVDKAPATVSKKRSARWNSYDSFSYSDSSDSDDYYEYSYYGSDFNENINENATDENEAAAQANLPQTNLAAGLEQVLTAAAASSMVSITAPQVLENPLFAEFRRATILNLRSPENFDQTAFEQAVLAAVQNRLGVAGSTLNLTWETKTENDKNWRELNLPALGWRINYALQDNELILADSSELLKSILEAKNEQAEQALFDELTIIRISQRKNAFDDVMQKIEQKKVKPAVVAAIGQAASDDNENNFFTGNVSSLLDTIEGVDRIEIRKNRSGGILEEEISFVLK